jgi:hypothetical protein
MTRGVEEDEKERERAFVEEVLDALTDTYLSLAKRWPEKPPEFDVWQGKSCAYMRRMVTRLRAGSMESPDSRYTAAQMAEIIEKIEEYQSEMRPLEAEFRKAEAVEARLCLRDEGDELKERLAKLIATKRRLSAYEGPGSRRAFRKQDHALRNMGARRGKRVRTPTEAYEAVYALEDAENGELGRLKERYVYGSR